MRGQPCHEAARQLPGINLMICGDLKGTGNLRAQERFTFPGSPHRQRFDPKACGKLDGAKVCERTSVGGVGTHGEGRRRAVSGSFHSLAKATGKRGPQRR